MANGFASVVSCAIASIHCTSWIKPKRTCERLLDVLSVLLPLSLPDYYEEGFLTLQHAIDEGIIEKLNPNATQRNVSVHLQRYPYPPYVDDFFVVALQSYLPLLFLLSFIVTAPSIVKDIVIEKESRLKVNTTYFRSSNIGLTLIFSDCSDFLVSTPSL